MLSTLIYFLLNIGQKSTSQTRKMYSFSMQAEHILPLVTSRMSQNDLRINVSKLVQPLLLRQVRTITF